VAFIADDLGAWLVGLLADAGRKRLTAWVVGSDEERALRSAAAAAIGLTARELCPTSSERAEELAMVVSHVSGALPPETPVGNLTMLEALQTGIARQLAPLGDAALTGTDQSSADVLGVSVGMLAETLTGHVVRQVIARGAHGGPLTPLAGQLNNDLTHLQGQTIESQLARVVEALNRQDPLPREGQREGTARDLFAQLVSAHTSLFAGRDREIADILGFVQARGNGYVFVEALSGYGKTSLLAQLVKRNPAFCYHFISQFYKRSGGGFDPTRRPHILQSLWEQLNPGEGWHGSPRDLEIEVGHLLSRPRANPAVVVMDGVDEVDPPGGLWGVLPSQLPDGIVVIFSARSQGDRSVLQDLNLPGNRVGLHVLLPGLNEAAISDLLAMAGGVGTVMAGDHDFAVRLREASRGDPFYIRFLVEDVASGVVTRQNVDQVPSGLEAYLDLQLEMLGRSAHRPQHAEILRQLLIAGEVSEEDLCVLVPGLSWLNFDEVMREIHRFLLVRRRRYTFCHDRFREYFVTRARPGSTDGDAS
jgi:hypothetical protein